MGRHITGKPVSHIRGWIQSKEVREKSYVGLYVESKKSLKTKQHETELTDTENRLVACWLPEVRGVGNEMGEGDQKI